MKYKVIGLSTIALVFLLMYLLFNPQKEDINPDKFYVKNVENIELKEKGKEPVTITDSLIIESLLGQILKSRKTEIDNPKINYNWDDIYLHFNDSSTESFRVYQNSDEGVYIAGKNFDYKNDSLKLLVDNILR